METGSTVRFYICTWSDDGAHTHRLRVTSKAVAGEQWAALLPNTGDYIDDERGQLLF
jgi:hypothetical protein